MMSPVMTVTMTDREMKPDHRPRIHRRRAVRWWAHHIDRAVHHHRRGLIDHRSWLINDWLLHDHWSRRVDDLRLLHHHWCRLCDHHRSWLHIDRWRRVNVNRFRLECLCDQQARSHTCHDFTSGCPSFIASFHARNRGSEHCQRRNCYQGFFHIFCSVGFDEVDARLFTRAGPTLQELPQLERVANMRRG